MTDKDDRNLYEELRQCRRVSDKRERAKCLFSLLSEITELQDKTQLEIPYLNPSIQFSMGLINNANAIILEASRHRGNIETVIDRGYLKQKVEYTLSDFNNIIMHYNTIVEEGYKPRLSCEELMQEKIPKINVGEQRKRVFKDQI